jgi:cyclin-dependent kinase inhibitor 3
MPPGFFDITSLTALPFGCPGQVYRSPMPFCNFDPQGDLLAAYRRAEISVVVLLTPDTECLENTGRDLRREYQKLGYDVIYLPICDYALPAVAELDQALEVAIVHLQAGRNMVVHCRAGMGRTGLFLACLAVRTLDKRGAEAITWLRGYIPGAVESSAQREMVLNYRKDGV